MKNLLQGTSRLQGMHRESKFLHLKIGKMTEEMAYTPHSSLSPHFSAHFNMQLVKLYTHTHSQINLIFSNNSNNDKLSCKY